jgi:hypothetical protein
MGMHVAPRSNSYLLLTRHAQAYRGHLRLKITTDIKSSMAGTSPAYTGHRHSEIHWPSSMSWESIIVFPETAARVRIVAV